jgi:hypothetical protein
VGVTTIDVPFEIDVPPQKPLYQTHEALVPNEPPTSDNVEETPGHTAVAEAETDDGAVDKVLSVTVVFTQPEV